MTVDKIMSRQPIVAAPNTPFAQVWKLIFEKRVSGLPIVVKGNVLVGIVSEEDVIEKLYPSYEEYFFDPMSAKNFEAMENIPSDVSAIPAKDFMSRNIFTTTEETPIMKAASTMLVNRVSCLPVVRMKQEKMILVGIICKGDIFGQLFKTMLGRKK